METLTNFKKLYDNIIAVAQNNDYFLEINPYLGNSTAYMAQLIAKSGLNITFDVLSDTAKRIPNVNYYSLKAIRRYKNRTLDFLFLDNSENLLRDIISWYPIMKHNGIIAGYKFNEKILKSMVPEKYIIINDCFVHKRSLNYDLRVHPGVEKKYMLVFGERILNEFDKMANVQKICMNRFGRKAEVSTEPRKIDDILNVFVR